MTKPVNSVESIVGEKSGTLIGTGAVLLLSGLAAGWSITLCLQTDVLADGANMGPLALVAISLIVAVSALIVWSAEADPRRALTVWHGLAGVLAGVGIGVLVANLGNSGSGRTTAIGFGVLVAAALLLLLSLSLGGKARRKATLVDDVIRTGVKVTAFVAHKGYDGFGESSQVNTPVRFEFTDAEGVERQVEKRLMILSHDPIEKGQETDLWYDPADPDDVDRIVVQLQLDHPAP